MQGRNLFDSLRKYAREELPKRFDRTPEQKVIRKVAELLELIEKTPRTQPVGEQDWRELVEENRTLRDSLDLLSFEMSTALETARRYHRIKDDKQKRLTTARKLISQADQNTLLTARLRQNMQQWLHTEDV